MEAGVNVSTEAVDRPVAAACCAPRKELPAHLPSGAALLALGLSEEARGLRGLDVLRRSVDRAPPSLG